MTPPPQPSPTVSAAQFLLEALNNLHRWSREGRSAPHKPFLLLLMLVRIQRQEPRLIHFQDLEPKLLSLLQSHLPQRGSHGASYPFWRLQNDGIWEVVVDNPADLVKRKSNTDPTSTSLRKANARGGLLKEHDALLRSDPALLRQAAQALLELLPKETHQSLINQMGLRLD